MAAWLERYWLAAGLALFMLLAVLLFLQYWSDPARPAPLLAFLATVLLVAVTAEYVRANQQSLRVLQELARRQYELGIKFSVRACHSRARVRVVNIGLPNAMVTRVVVRALRRKPLTLYKHMIVRSGGRQGFYLPDQVWSGALQLHLEVALHCESVGQRSVEARAYTLFMTAEGRVHKVLRGLHSLWPVTCPNCGSSADLYMRTDGLADFAAAFARQQSLRLHLERSCPQHDSPWLLRQPAPATRFGPTQEVPSEWQGVPGPSPFGVHHSGRS